MKVSTLTATLAAILALASTSANGQVVGTATVPATQSASTSFAGYFDEEEVEKEKALPADLQEEDDEEEADDEDFSSDSCGDDVDCGDGCGEDECNAWECGGWFQQGFTFNGYSPSDGFNGVVNTNDQANQWQMNQLWFYMAKEIDPTECGWQLGGRIDFVYGTDAQYLQMNDGWEESWDMNATFYQIATPQMYAEVGGNDWSTKVGRFTSPLTMEGIMAVDNFFYSRSYIWFPSPNNLFGFITKRHLTDEWGVSGGLVRGEDQFNDTDGKDQLDVVAGFDYKSLDEESWFEVWTLLGEKGPNDHTNHWSVMGGTQLTEQWEYAGEWYYGETFANQNAEWYGINNHLYRWVNDQWAYGFRFEWFRDDDGEVIYGFREGNDADGPFIGNFYEATFAINYTPCEKLVLRPEARWDWFDPDQRGGPRPFDDQTKDNQFIVSLDMIYTF